MSDELEDSLVLSGEAFGVAESKVAALMRVYEAAHDLLTVAELLMNNSLPGVTEGVRMVHDKDFSLLRGSVLHWRSTLAAAKPVIGGEP